jgi:hypothetical protein
MKIKPQAGTMRGVRVMRDPLGILTDPFMDPVMGGQFGYVVVYGEAEPAVFDGETWHPIYEGDASNWTGDQMSRLQVQMMRIAQAATTEPVYAELARLLGMPVQTSSIPVPADSTFEPAVDVIDYSKKNK